MNPLAHALDASFDRLGPELLGIYKDLHSHPELSMQEQRTAGIAAEYIEKLGYAVTRAVGVTGVVGVLRNGDGPTVMLRGDMDALPMIEDTGLPYASLVTATDADGQQVGVAHSCGHDLHVTWLMGAARVLADARDAWRGTALVVFQPGEEVAQGANAMVQDWDAAGLPHPDIVLGQHVMVGRRNRQLPRRRHPVGGRQPAGKTIRTWIAWFATADFDRSCSDGGLDRAAPADHRLARGLAIGERGADHRCAAGRHQGKHHPRRRHHQAQHAHLR
jgi:hypothetical protein